MVSYWNQFVVQEDVSLTFGSFLCFPIIILWKYFYVYLNKK